MGRNRPGQHPVVKKANDPNQLMTVSEFLREVRRMVVDFVVGRVLTQDGDQEAATGLDDVTTYYLPPSPRLRHGRSPHRRLHPLRPIVQPLRLRPRQPARPPRPSGQRRNQRRTRRGRPPEDAEETSGGAKVKLKPYNRRQGRNLGLEAPGGRSVPLID